MSRSVEGDVDVPGSYYKHKGDFPWPWSAPETLAERKSTMRSDVWMLGKKKTNRKNRGGMSKSKKNLPTTVSLSLLKKNQRT